MSSGASKFVRVLRLTGACEMPLPACEPKPPRRISLKELANRWEVHPSTASRRIRHHGLLVMKEGTAASSRVYVDPREVFALECTWGWHRNACA